MRCEIFFFIRYYGAKNISTRFEQIAKILFESYCQLPANLRQVSNSFTKLILAQGYMREAPSKSRNKLNIKNLSQLLEKLLHVEGLCLKLYKTYPINKI